MGQQQLLVLIFFIVLIGGVVVAGAHAVDGGKRGNNRGIVFQEALGIVSEVQLWKFKPAQVGGGNGKVGFAGINFRKLHYPHSLLSNRVYKTDFACYTIRTITEEQHAEIIISAPSCSMNDFVARVVVKGTGPGDLDWLHTPSSGFRAFDQ
ncbi:MAG: hypothetical protein ACE5G0_21200 [Rhodothermales bacterium]